MADLGIIVHIQKVGRIIQKGHYFKHRILLTFGSELVKINKIKRVKVNKFRLLHANPKGYQKRHSNNHDLGQPRGDATKLWNHFVISRQPPLGLI